MGDYGCQVLPDMYVVSWLGMTADNIDCHVYALRGQDGILLIDCGTTWGHDRIKQNMAHWGMDISAVKTILLTHYHLDHIYGGPLFMQYGTEIYGHADMAEFTEHQWASQCGMDKNGDPYRLNGIMKDGDHLNKCGFDIEVIHTPGHTDGCLSFLITVNGQRCLFTGDLIMSDGNPGYTGDKGHNRNTIINIMKRLQKIDFDHLCHGHDVIFNDRGWLFNFALCRESSGEWDLPESRYMQDIAANKK